MVIVAQAFKKTKNKEFLMRFVDALRNDEM